jgi:superoxide dismutase, Fe-Mn family
MKIYTVPDLSYGFNSLEPYIDAKTMEIHHDKHHGAYVSKLNAALEKHPHLFDVPLEHLLANLPSVAEDIRIDVRNNGGGHINHSMFWEILSPGGGDSPVGDLSTVLIKSFSTLDGFKKAFDTAAAQRFGSGWAWLSLNAIGDLVVHSTANQDSPLIDGLTPVMGLDVWEHAYYLIYQNRRPDYINAFWNIINWKQAEKNYQVALKTVRTVVPVSILKKAS